MRYVVSSRLFLACFALLFSHAFSHSLTNSLSAAEKQTVSLTIKFSEDQEKEFTEIRWSEEMTVLDALKAADALPEGIDFVSRGKGATAFVTSIDGIKNKGAFGSNWVFQVNGEKADKGCGVYKLGAGDKVLWKYAK
jgi:hypothetical protein